MSARVLSVLCLLLLPLLIVAEERRDADGDPLPKGALFRLGSARWRHDGQIGAIVCSRDGKSVVSFSPFELCIWDATNGKRINTIPVNKPAYSGKLALSHDDRHVAFPDDGGVVICSVADGKRLFTLKRKEQQHYCLTFSPDGKTLVTTTEEQLLFWDATTGKLQTEIEEPGWSGWATFSPDGKTLFCTRYVDRRIRPVSVNVATGKWAVLSGLEKESWLCFGLSPDCKTLAICVTAPGKPTLVLMDVASGRELQRVSCEAVQYQRLSFSPDGKTVAMIFSYGLSLCDVSTGKVQTREEWAPSSWGGASAFSSDGKTLYTLMDHRIRRWSLPDLKEIDPVDEQRITEVLRYSPSGSVLFAAHRAGPLRLWDLSNGKVLHTIQKQPYNSRHAAFTPDGGTVIASFMQRNGDGPRRLAPREDPRGVSHLDVKTGKLSPGHGADERGYIAVSPDAGLLAPSLLDEVEVWDRIKDRKIASFPRRKDLPRNGTQRTLPMAFSPDGQRIALILETRTIVVWDHQTGAQLKLDKSEEIYNNLHAEFSPDGLLICVTELSKQVVWDALTGHRIAQVSKYYAPLMHFTRDGRGLVMSDPTEKQFGSNLKLYDLAEGKFVRDLPTGPLGSVGTFALSPDHKTLTTAQANGSLLVWDATSFLKPIANEARDLTEKEMLELWTDLAGEGQRTLSARWKLASAKGVAPFLKGRIAVGKPAAKEVAANIALLDHDKFDERNKAFQWLEQWGNQVEAELKAALAKKPSAEAQRRLEGLIEKLEARPAGDIVRWLRGIAVLEAAGDAESRKLLKSLADGGRGARLCDAARAALKRLEED